MELTDEQRRIVKCDLKQDDILRIIAFAGTGKTTTLIEYAKARPHLRFLYLAFNKSVQLEADRKFPGNVICKTSHSLAFRNVGYRYRHKIVTGIKAFTVRETLKLNSYEEAKFAIDTLLKYLGSINREISRDHVPKGALSFYRTRRTPMPDIVKLANDLWNRMCDPEDDSLGMLHDGYLKLYQLSNPVLSFDVIMIDEGQDLNPCQAYIGLKQNVARIIAGDSHQQIYAFRGAKDFMRRVKATRTLYLTQSFRFGPNVAKLANMILSFFKDEEHPVAGLRKKNRDLSKQRRTIIARSNAFVFKKAVQLYNKKKIGFVGGIQGYRLQTMADLHHLRAKQPEKINTPFLRAFKRFRDVLEYGKIAEDVEIMSACAVVEEFESRIPSLIEKIKAAATNEEDADIILTTAHKAKGLEWDNVELCDDFTDLMDRNGKPVSRKSVEVDEINLIYVAVTRARENLIISRKGSLESFIKWYLRNGTIKKA